MTTKWVARSGREYNMRVDVRVISDVKDITGVNLFQMPSNDDPGPVFQLWNDDLLLLQVLAVCFESQSCKNPELSKDEFLDELGDSDDGDVNGLKNCYDAFRVEWSNFFRNAKSDPTRADLIDRSWEAIQKASKVGTMKLKMVFDQEMKKLEGQLSELT